MLVPLLLVGCAGAVAYANGANDVSKGVATLVGSRLSTHRQGLQWGAFWTVAGAAVALMLTSTMLRTFSTGLVGASTAQSATFPLAVAIGAFLWVLIASRTGLPVSTTHSLVGAIVGAVMIASGAHGVRWALAFKSVALPLAFSPAAAALLAYAVHAVINRRLAEASRYCLCRVDHRILIPDSPLGGAVAARSIRLPVVVVDEERTCAAGGTVGPAVRVTDGMHWLTSAALSFARGLNDMPKIVALAIAAAAGMSIATPTLYLVLALVMGAGSLWSGGRVTRTLAERVTDIDALQGLTASAVAAGLVLAASVVALPVSTTHVASGAIVGVGLRSGSSAVDWRTVSNMAAAWLVTVPVSAACGAIAWMVLTQ